MKRKLLLPVVLAALVITSAAAHAQIGGCILLYSDPGWTSCEAMDTPTLVTVYVVHRFHTGVTSSQFRVVDYGTNWTYITDQTQGLTIAIVGNSQTGAIFGYQMCHPSDVGFLNILYLGTMTAQACSFLQVEADPLAPSGMIEATDCSDNTLTAHPSILVVNGDGTCMCAIVDPVEETSWGQIKSLYGE